MPAPLASLAQLVTTGAATPLPEDVREAARRTLYNVLATSVGASREPATDVVVRVAAGFADSSAAATAAVPGRPETLAPLDAAFATGVAAHLDDYDDTHLATVIHPGAVCLAALVGLQDELADATDDEVLTAFAWGVEAQLRLGVAVSPEHYDAGWHITGTCGTVGAAVTAALVLGLDAERLAVALDWAVEYGLGNREGFGSMTKPFHPGKAAVRGLRAARDAAAGAPSPGDTLTGPDGFVARLARGKLDEDALLGEPGVRWELSANTFKPYPCGIVSHPAIEAAEALHARLADAGGPESVAAVRLVCHPLVPELTGNVQPLDGLQARFSTAHGVAAGLLQPKVDLTGYATELVVSEPAKRLRALVQFEATPDCPRDAATLHVTLADGTVLGHEVTHALGSLARPLTDDELRGKAEGLVDRVVAGGAAALDAATRRQGAGYVAGLLAACTPGGECVPAVVTAGPEPSDDSEDHVLARRLAEFVPATAAPASDVAALAAEAERVRAAHADADERERAGAVAAALARDGHSPERAAAAAACASAAALAEALDVTGEVAVRLDVPSTRLAVFAATVAAVLANGLSARAALQALGLAATQTTTVTGTERVPAVAAVRARHAAEDGIEAAALARGGFTAPRHPLTGRRAMVSLLAGRALVG